MLLPACFGFAAEKRAPPFGARRRRRRLKRERSMLLSVTFHFARTLVCSRLTAFLVEDPLTFCSALLSALLACSYPELGSILALSAAAPTAHQHTHRSTHDRLTRTVHHRRRIDNAKRTTTATKQNNRARASLQARQQTNKQAELPTLPLSQS